MKDYTQYNLMVIGAGQMSREYCHVLKSLDQSFFVLGNKENKTDILSSSLGIESVSGGLDKFLKNHECPKYAIICTPVESLFEISHRLLDSSVENILVEKPGSLDAKELQTLRDKASTLDKNIHIAYNRRFYQSILALKQLLLKEDLIGVNFEITEWTHTIDVKKLAKVTLERWFISNTSHIVDLVLHIAGPIKELSSYVSGSLKWHKGASRFVGSGLTESNVLVSYSGYWDGPGRWSIEFITKKNKYILRPLEKLQYQSFGTTEIKEVDSIDYSLDNKFKPGLYNQVNSFIHDDLTSFCTVDQQIDSIKVYEKMANYKTQI